MMNNSRLMSRHPLTVRPPDGYNSAALEITQDGKEIGVNQWFLNRNENFQRAAAIVAAPMMHWKPTIWFSAAIVVKCASLTQSAPNADITRDGK
jgi:hypothetical protein